MLYELDATCLNKSTAFPTSVFCIHLMGVVKLTSTWIRLRVLMVIC